MTAPVRVGVVTPVVIQQPGMHGEWERSAGIDEIAEVARAADGLGFEYLTCSDHVGIPAAQAPIRSTAYWAPAPTLSYIAACTERIRLLTYVLVLGYHHPLDVAKTYGTLDRISDGRLILGVGVGSLREEFDVLGVPFDGRGARANDALRAIRASFGRSEPAYHGTDYRFGGMVIDPCGVQERVPLWVGGQSKRSLRRAVDLADGWIPFGRSLTPGQLVSMLDEVELPDDFELVLSPDSPLDPGGEPEGTGATLEGLRQLGATTVNVFVQSRSLQHYLEQLASLAAIAQLTIRDDTAPASSARPMGGAPTQGVPADPGSDLVARVREARGRAATWEEVGRAVGLSAADAEARFAAETG